MRRRKQPFLEESRARAAQALSSRGTATLAEAAVRGRELGSLLYPDSDVGETLHPSVVHRTKVAEADLARLERLRAERIRVTSTALVEARTRRVHRQERFNDRLREARTVEKALRDATSAVESDDRHAHRTQETRCSVAGISHFVVLAAMGVGEAAINYLVLALWGASAIATWGVTAALGLSQMLASHFAGAALSEKGGSDARAKKLFSALLWLVGISLAGTLVGLAFLRTIVLQHDVEVLGITMNPVLAGITFGFIQLIFNAVALYIGATRHSNSVSGLKMVRSRLRTAAWRLERCRRALAKAEAVDLSAQRGVTACFAEFAAWATELVAEAEADIESFYDGFVRAADLERAAALAEQTRPVINPPKWAATASEDTASVLAGMPPIPQLENASKVNSNGHYTPQELTIDVYEDAR